MENVERLFVAVNDPAMTSGPISKLRQLLETIADRKVVDEETSVAFEKLVHQAHAARRIKPGTKKIQWFLEAKSDDQSRLFDLILTADHLLQHGEVIRIKKCAGEWCPVLFFDLSKNRSRKWCDMAHCGMLRKSRKYYDKHRRAN